MHVNKRLNDITPEEWDLSARVAGWGVSTEDFSVEKEKSDGSTANYYQLPNGAKELQDLISDKNMNAQIGEVFRECYRYGKASHSDEMRGIKKILFYANAELKRLEKLNKL
jgi:hypothetical protein